MDYKKTNAPTNTVTRNMMDLCEDTGNVYETVAIIGNLATNRTAFLACHTLYVTFIGKRQQRGFITFVNTQLGPRKTSSSQVTPV